MPSFTKPRQHMLEPPEAWVDAWSHVTGASFGILKVTAQPSEQLCSERHFKFHFSIFIKMLHLCRIIA